MPYLPARGKGGAALVKCKLKNDFSLFSFSFYHERVNGPGAIFLYSEGAFQKVIVSIYHGTECIQFVAPAGQIEDTYLT